ncbi:MAG: aldo/keto reductase [Pseudomonadota bacterium]
MKKRVFERIAGKRLEFTELGFGTAMTGNLYENVSDETAQSALDAAWETGVRYFDTAPLYGLGLAETRMNRFLREKDRDSYVLSTKIGRLLEVCAPQDRTAIGKFFGVPNRREVYDFTYDGTMRSIDFSLERLGVDRIDLLFAHDLDIFNHGTWDALQPMLDQFMDGGYKALLELRDQGVIKAFGAGINEYEPAQWMLERGDFDIFLLAGRYTLLEQQALETFFPICEERGVGVVLGGPYNSGILATGPVEGAHFNYDLAPPHVLERVGAIQAVCERHGVKLIEAALRFPINHPVVLTVIPGAKTADHARQNKAFLDADLPKAFWDELMREGLMREDAPVPVANAA